MSEQQATAGSDVSRDYMSMSEDDALTEPPYAEVPRDHKLWKRIDEELRMVFDPEIPVNIYELGLIYLVDIDDNNNVYVRMTLTAPGCPVAGEMPGMISDAIRRVEGIGDIDVELVWDPPWDPSKMAETAKLMLNMY